MITLALNMIAKNEAPRIHLALRSAAEICDELIVIDTGSTDRTVDFAVEHGATATRGRTTIQQRATRQSIAQRPTGSSCLTPTTCSRTKRSRGSSSSSRNSATSAHRPGDKNRSDRSGQLRALRGANERGVATARTWYNYASELRNSGNLREAIAAFRQYLGEAEESLPGGRYHALVSAAACHLALGEIPDGREAAARAVLLDASRAEAYAVIGESEFMRRRYEATIPLFKAAVNSTLPLEGHVAAETYTWLAHERLAACYVRIGEGLKARAHATAALIGHPHPARSRARSKFDDQPEIPLHELRSTMHAHRTIPLTTHGRGATALGTRAGRAFFQVVRPCGAGSARAVPSRLRERLRHGRSLRRVSLATDAQRILPANRGEATRGVACR